MHYLRQLIYLLPEQLSKPNLQGALKLDGNVRPRLCLATPAQPGYLLGATGRRHPYLQQSCTRLKLPRAAGDVWVFQQSAELWVEPQSGKNSKTLVKWHVGEGFSKLCHPQIHWYDIPKCRRNVLHSNEHTQWIVKWCGVRQLRWQHISPVVLTLSTSMRLLSSFSSKHYILPHSSSLFLYFSLFVVPNPVFLISGLSLQFVDVDVFFLQSKVFSSKTHSLSSEPIPWPFLHRCRGAI